jgi:hypothetical protein
MPPDQKVNKADQLTYLSRNIVEQHILKAAFDLQMAPLKRFHNLLCHWCHFFNKSECFNEEQCIFEQYINIETIKNIYNHIFLLLKLCSVYLFRAALYELILELHRDVLLNC